MSAKSIEESVLQCLRDSYQITGTLLRLSGENLNYLVTTKEGLHYVAKVVDDDMPAEVVELEFEASKYAISMGFELQLPEIVQNIYGKIETGIKIHIKDVQRLLLLTYVSGIVLDNVPDISVELLQNLGKSLARYNIVMQGFDHPAAHRSHRWSLVEVGRHRDKISLVENAEKRALLEWGFSAWKQVENELETLPWQFIHGDMNPENILVEGDHVTGLVDFGDACLNPLICELAICLTYIMMDRDDPLEAARIVTRAYDETLPLSDAELSVLIPLICGRLASSIAIAAARRKIDPDNPNWFGSEESAWELLAKLRNFS
jgi:Ser/Thr protein kinase RdoA (MazF antagonist)